MELKSIRDALARTKPKAGRLASAGFSARAAAGAGGVGPIARSFPRKREIQVEW